MTLSKLQAAERAARSTLGQAKALDMAAFKTMFDALDAAGPALALADMLRALDQLDIGYTLEYLPGDDGGYSLTLDDEGSRLPVRGPEVDGHCPTWVRSLPEVADMLMPVLTQYAAKLPEGMRP